MMQKDSMFRGDIGGVMDFKADGEGVFEGYAAVYSVVDRGMDMIIPGAFDESLRMYPAPKIKMLMFHDMRRVIGVWDEAVSDQHGLFVKGHLLTSTTDGKDAYELIKGGAIDGLSIGYRTLLDDYDRQTGVRTIKAAELREISLVTFPMNEAAVITNVKNLSPKIDSIKSLSEAERFLREAEGPMSRKEAMEFVSVIKKIAQREAGSDQGGDNAAYLKLAAAIRCAT